MAKSSLTNEQIENLKEEVRGLIPEQQLQRLRYYIDEIATTKSALKAQQDSAKDYISEMEARIAIVIGEVEPGHAPASEMDGDD